MSETKIIEAVLTECHYRNHGTMKRSDLYSLYLHLGGKKNEKGFLEFVRKYYIVLERRRAGGWYITIEGEN